MNVNITKTTVLAATQEQVSADLSSDLSGEVVILDLKGGIYYELSGVGARVWELIQRPRSFQAVLDTLLEEYNVNPQRCEADLLALLEDLSKHKLIDIDDTAPKTAQPTAS